MCPGPELVRFWMDRHVMFRDVLGRLRSTTEGLIDAKSDPAQSAHQIGRYAGFLLNELHTHHNVEDHHYFPQSVGLDARVSHGFEILDSDHHALDGHIHALADRTNALLRAAQGAQWRDPAVDLNTGLTEFERFLDRHLTDEEDLIVPVILTHAPDLH